MKYIKKTLCHFEEILGCVLLVLICAVATLQAGSRFLSNFITGVRPVYWTEEACTFLFIWLCFIGASLALKTGDHFAVEIIRAKLPVKIGWMVHMFCLVAVTLFCCVLVWYGADLVWRSRFIITPSLQISKSIPYAAIPFGGLLMLFRSIERIIRVQVRSPQSTTQEGVAG